MNDIQLLIKELAKFCDARHWEQFHNSKDLALAISIEAAELNELFLWKTTEESELVDRNKIKEELADILAFSLLLAGIHGFMDASQNPSHPVCRNWLGEVVK